MGAHHTRYGYRDLRRVLLFDPQSVIHRKCIGLCHCAVQPDPAAGVRNHHGPECAVSCAGLWLVGSDFGAKTIYTSILLPFILGVLEKAFPDNRSIMGDQFLDMLCYTMLVSLGIALLFMRNASSGGLDIAAKILNRYLHIELGAALSMSGMVVALSSALVYDIKTVVLSVMGTYLGGIVLDHFIFGLNTKKKVSILSSHIDEIRRFVIEDLHSGATLYQAIGAYDYAEQRELVVIVNKAEYAKLMTFLAAVDKNAFVTVYTVHEMFYRPKPGRDK